MRKTTVLFSIVIPGLALSAQTPQSVDYEQHVKPLLAAKCFSCHGRTQAQSGLRLDLRQNALRGGDYGVVIVPGRSAESKFMARISGSTAGLRMPPTGELTPEEIEVFRAWIDQGAEMPGRAEERERRSVRTDPKTQALIDAIGNHDDAPVRRALKKDRSLAHATDGAGSTLLMHAAYVGTLAIMEALLDCGADVNATNQRRAGAAHWAVAEPAKLKLLIARGAAIDTKTVEGRTPLFLAAGLPDGASSVALLLEAGASPNARNIAGATPLFAAASNNTESARLLIANGADVNARSETGGTALMAAATSNPKAVAMLLEAGADAGLKTKRNETALAAAANRGSLESVKLLVEHGADVNVADYRGYTPLMHAAYNDRAPAELVRFLIAQGARDQRAASGETALTFAAGRGETEVKRLINGIR